MDKQTNKQTKDTNSQADLWTQSIIVTAMLFKNGLYGIGQRDIRQAVKQPNREKNKQKR